MTACVNGYAGELPTSRARTCASELRAQGRLITRIEDLHDEGRTRETLKGAKGASSPVHDGSEVGFGTGRAEIGHESEDRELTKGGHGRPWGPGQKIDTVEELKT